MPTFNTRVYKKIKDRETSSLEEREETVSNFSKACDFSKTRNEVAVTFSGNRFFFLDLLLLPLDFFFGRLLKEKI